MWLGGNGGWEEMSDSIVYILVRVPVLLTGILFSCCFPHQLWVTSLILINRMLPYAQSLLLSIIHLQPLVPLLVIR